MNGADSQTFLATSIRSKLRRRLTARRSVMPLCRVPDGFTLTISFDDVPLTGVLNGAPLIEAAGGRATWYVASGLVGTTSASGQIASAPEYAALAERGHEIALHTHAHPNCDRMHPSDVITEIARNRQNLTASGCLPSANFAYPYGETNVALKRALMGRVATARGILPGVNRRGSDALQLLAYDLRPDGLYLARAEAGIHSAARDGGWVILFTHDVQDQPSRYGTTPALLTGLIERSLSLGARLRTVAEVIAEIALTSPH